MQEQQEQQEHYSLFLPSPSDSFIESVQKSSRIDTNIPPEYFIDFTNTNPDRFKGTGTRIFNDIKNKNHKYYYYVYLLDDKKNPMNERYF